MPQAPTIDRYAPVLAEFTENPKEEPGRDAPGVLRSLNHGHRRETVSREKTQKTDLAKLQNSPILGRLAIVNHFNRTVAALAQTSN